VQMPDTRQEPSHALMRLIAADGPWADRLVPVAKTRAVIATHSDYYRWLKPISASLDIWQTTYVHPLDGIEAIVDWFRGSALRPFLAPLSPSERLVFLQRYRRDLAEAYEVEPDGNVLFVYPRLFLLARKAA
jgi:trans-aconitate 2-methyltransferase